MICQCSVTTDFSAENNTYSLTKNQCDSEYPGKRAKPKEVMNVALAR